MHHFRDAGLNQEGPPSDRVVIFDEAQRAWNREMTADFMRRKKGRPGFTQSEPEFLLSYLDRHSRLGGSDLPRGGWTRNQPRRSWYFCLAGRSVDEFTGWSAYISPSLTDSEYDAGHALQSLGTKATVVADESLHLSVSMRSFRAEHVSRFVKAVLDRETSRRATS